MKQYHDLINRVRAEGDVMPNRTGVDAIKVVGEMFKFDLRQGYPILTTKKTSFKMAMNETFCFFRGYTNAADFRTMGVTVWDKNANEHGVKPNAWLSNPFREGLDHLGAVYGDQWRNWPGYKVLSYDQYVNDALTDKLKADGWAFLGSFQPDEDDGVHEKYVFYKPIDQLADCVKKIIETPEDRRIIFHAWNVGMLDAMALPPCHLLYQFFPNTVKKRLDMLIYVRSNDLCLGTPFNMVGAATVLAAMAKVTGYEAGVVSYVIGDAHVYSNQHAYLDEQMVKEPYPLPTWKWGDKIPGGYLFSNKNPNWVSDAISWLTKMTANDIIIENYQHHTLQTPVPPMVV